MTKKSKLASKIGPPIAAFFIISAIVGFFYVKKWELYRPSYGVSPYKPVKKSELSIYVSFETGFESYILSFEEELKYEIRKDKTIKGYVDVPVGEMAYKFFRKNLKDIFKNVYFPENTPKNLPSNSLKLKIFIPEVRFERVYWDDPVASYLECEYEMSTAGGDLIFYFTSNGFGSKALYEHLGYTSQSKYYNESAKTAMVRAYNDFVIYIQKASTIEKLYPKKVISGE